MAILSKIRERSMFLIVIIGLALFAFVASPKDIIDFFSSNKINSVGVVNEEVISRQEFATRVEAYKSSNGNRITEMQAINAVWNRILSEKIYQEQLEKAGIVVGEKDIWNGITQISSIQNAEIFKNEIGLFDEEKLKEYIANLKESANGQANSAWLNWLDTEKNVAANIERKAYTQLVKLGTGASLVEGKRKYFEAQTKLSGSYVYLPYSSIKNEEVKVSPEEVEAYVAQHDAEFTVDETRDIEYVKFDIKASAEDEEAIKAELISLIEDKEEYSNATKSTIEVVGFENTEDAAGFIAENDSDLPLDTKYLYKNNLPTVVADELFNAEEGTVVGPYKFQNHLRLSKVEDVIKMPDSVKASHILISYVGARSANETVIRTEEEAEKLADSIVKVVKKSSAKFATLAKNLSADTSNASKGGELDWFTYNQMVPEFRDYAFLNKKGSIGIVKTVFGIHVIKITDQKNYQKAIQLATIARKIEASEATENEIFEEAETLAYKLSSGGNYEELVKEGNYVSRPLVGVKAMDDNLSGLGASRSIVRWAFDEETALKSGKRFDLDNGYAVVVLTNKAAKGLMSSAKAYATVEPILIKEKKAALLAAKMNATSLEGIATANNTAVKQFSNVKLSAPTIPGVGTEPAVVGAMYGVTVDKLAAKIVGEKGVFALEVANKELPEELSSYEGARNSLVKENQNKVSGQIYTALKDISSIEDLRANMY